MTGKSKDRVSPRTASDLPHSEGDLGDGEEFIDVVVTGDHSGSTASDVTLAGCRIEAARLLGTHLIRGRLMDCVVTACDLSGLVLEECIAARVEFRECRLSSLQAGGSRFRDVAFVGCKLDDANFRMTTWERAEFDRCELAGADFYAASLPGSVFRSCDLSGADFSKSTLGGSRLQHSNLESLKGASALGGVTITSDLILPAAMALFTSMAITVDDDQ